MFVTNNVYTTFILCQCRGMAKRESPKGKSDWSKHISDPSRHLAAATKLLLVLPIGMIIITWATPFDANGQEPFFGLCGAYIARAFMVVAQVAIATASYVALLRPMNARRTAMLFARTSIAQIISFVPFVVIGVLSGQVCWHITLKA